MAAFHLFPYSSLENARQRWLCFILALNLVSLLLNTGDAARSAVEHHQDAGVTKYLAGGVQDARAMNQ